MTTFLTNNVRDLVAAPFIVSESRTRVGDALWLYVWLVSHANTAGHICRTQSTLAADLNVTESVVEQWIANLAATHLIEIHTPSPYLVLKLRFWRGSGASSTLADAENGLQTGLQKPVQNNVPVSSSLLLPDSITSKPIDRGVDRGLGEGEGLVAEAQAVLGLAEVAPLRDLIAQHPPPVVRQALVRVASTPAAQIRKSRFALFRYLLNTLPTNSPP